MLLAEAAASFGKFDAGDRLGLGNRGGGGNDDNGAGGGSGSGGGSGGGNGGNDSTAALVGGCSGYLSETAMARMAKQDGSGRGGLEEEDVEYFLERAEEKTTTAFDEKEAAEAGKEGNNKLDRLLVPRAASSLLPNGLSYELALFAEDPTAVLRTKLVRPNSQTCTTDQDQAQERKLEKEDKEEEKKEEEGEEVVVSTPEQEEKEKEPEGKKEATSGDAAAPAAASADAATPAAAVPSTSEASSLDKEPAAEKAEKAAADASSSSAAASNKTKCVNRNKSSATWSFMGGGNGIGDALTNVVAEEKAAVAELEVKMRDESEA
jgi:hypothetical protein